MTETTENSTEDLIVYDRVFEFKTKEAYNEARGFVGRISYKQEPVGGWIYQYLSADEKGNAIYDSNIVRHNGETRRLELSDSVREFVENKVREILQKDCQLDYQLSRLPEWEGA